MPEEKLENLDIVGKWCYFIMKSGELSSKEIESLSKEPELKMAVKHFKSLSEDQKLIQRIQEDNSIAAYKNALAFSKEEGFNIGIEKGKEEEKKILIANFYKQGVAVSSIARAVSWSEEKVLKLIKELGLKE